MEWRSSTGISISPILLNTAGLSYMPRLIRPNQDYLIVANDMRIRNQQTEAFQDDHAEWEREIANIHAPRLLIELNLGVNAILPNVPNAVQYADRMKRNKPYKSCCPDKTSPLDPRSVPSHNYQYRRQQETLQYCVRVWRRREWSRITGGYSTGSPSPATIFAMSILRPHFAFVHFTI